jgi:hypothetical protein
MVTSHLLKSLTDDLRPEQRLGQFPLLGNQPTDLAADTQLLFASGGFSLL